MAITIEDDLQPLIDLLWVRETWNVKPAGVDLPPLLSVKPSSADAETASADTAAEWQEAWPAMWQACLHHAGQIRDATLFEQLRGTAIGSAKRVTLLHELLGPSWRGTFGDEAFTDQYQAWNQALSDSSRRHFQPLEEEPERVSLAALISAWHAGLSKIVVIPCKGSYTRVIGQHALLVTAETRDDPERYGEALQQFR
ncbi:hypothetical protein [Glaciihabitans sp. UYNi722]|uniref:hypothetical protein n=1 Tax=Glaciihabitans sp. UYNi722 TaxID=3156344 RepID=UPI003391E693